MSTRIEYVYRDGANNKQWHTVVVAGTLTKDQLTPYLEQGRYFIPSQVGLDDLQGAYAEWIPGLDHAWHELDDVTATSERPTEAIFAEELLQRFATVRWDEAAAGPDIP